MTAPSRLRSQADPETEETMHPMHPMHPMTVLLAGTQRIGAFDAYDAGSLVLGLVAGAVLVVRQLSAAPGERGLRGHPVDELLAFLVLLAVTVLAVHQLVTDDLCHGACSLSPGPSSG